MSVSDGYGSDGDDTAFLAAATQVEASQSVAFATSPRPAKRRRVRGPSQLDRASSEELERSGSDGEHSSPQILPRKSATTTAPTQRSDASGDADEDPDYYFPGELDAQDEQPAKQSKYKIHVPKNGRVLQDLYLTQTQVGLDEDPTALRGAIWKKPKPPPPPLFNGGVRTLAPISPASRAPARGIDSFLQRQPLAQRQPPSESDEALARRLQAEENAQSRKSSTIANGRPAVPATPGTQVDDDLADLPSDAFSSSAPEIVGATELNQARANGLRAPQTGLKQMTIFGKLATQDLTASQAATKKHNWPLSAREEPATHHKLDAEEMKTWVYPTNLGSIRDYQLNIVTRGMFHNTLVALPTGLGKTFIAATIMLNWYRWTSSAQIVFMAPTKPLIAQQMEACYGIVGINRRDTVLMTGETTPGIRAEEWLDKRVFFMTPQTVINDLKSGICDPKKIVLIVVDEAHKATGGYAYTEVVSFLRRFNTSFRVLALTATPGSTVEAVQAVIDNLGIARIELRTEQSLDIVQYTHRKDMETELFDYSDEQQLIMDHMSKALKPILDKLNGNNAYWLKDPMSLTAYGLQMARTQWARSDAGRKAPQGLKGMVQALFTVLSQIAHSLSLLKFHGIAPFFASVLEFQRNVESGQTKGKYAQQITQSEDWTKAMSFMRTWSSNPDFIGHPKLQYLREVVMNHFLDAGDGVASTARATRIMVFASYRDSTQDICRVLKRNEPMIRPSEFVGQAASKGSEGMNQKKQNAVIQDFKSGKFNVLVATSIGEEGLDIGDVDLIVCYDSSASPIRMLQRIGRTGRKRVGRVVLTLMRGKEENDFAKAKDNYSHIQKTIADEKKYAYRDDQSPRILPKEAQPVVVKRVVDIPLENSQPVDLNEKARKQRGRGKIKRPPKKFHMPDNVRTGFVSAKKLGSGGEESEDIEVVSKVVKKKAPPKPKKRAPSPQLEPAQIPYLDDVTLNDDQQRELERKYAQTNDLSDNTVVQAPDPSRFPDSLRVLTATKYLRHGRASEAVSKALQAIRAIDEDRVERMKSLFQESDLTDMTGMRARLVSPVAEPDSDAELPSLPILTAAKKRKPTKRKAVSKSKTTPRAQPQAKKSNASRRAALSSDMERSESSPEPTPAHLKLGTQGIDLGSRDTSGEDNDNDEADSDLEQFVVGSDQPVEMASSSLPGTPARRRMQLDVLVESDEDDAVEEVEAPAAGRGRLKRRRVVADEDEDDDNDE
ncbi:3'-5' DNA helicase [Oleoguttula sp. CCFEE 5521]